MTVNEEKLTKLIFFARVLYMLIWNILRYFLKSALLSQIFEAGIAGTKNLLPTTSIGAWSTLYVSFVMRNSPANKFYVFFRVPRLAPFGPLLTFTDAVFIIHIF